MSNPQAEVPNEQNHRAIWESQARASPRLTVLTKPRLVPFKIQLERRCGWALLPIGQPKARARIG
jgi:hypothetical protein